MQAIVARAAQAEPWNSWTFSQALSTFAGELGVRWLRPSFR